MSARQPFLPSRPASRAINTGDDVVVTSVNTGSANSSTASESNNHPELVGATRPLNISGFKKFVPRTGSFGVPVDPSDAPQGNNSGGGIPASRSTVKGSATTRIYAPRPFTPPVATTPQDPTMAFPAQVFKTPLLPFANSADEAGATGSAGPGPGEINTRSSTSTAADASGVSNLFRPISCRPQDEIGDAQTRRPIAHQQSFFGGGQFSFDSVTSSVDDSGYYSSVSEQNDREGDQIAPAKRNNLPTTRPTAGNEVYKRIRPSSPDEGEGVVLTRQNSRSRDIPKRLCARRSPSRSHGTFPRPAMPENASAEGTQSFILPPNIPHPTTAIGDLPGLEFSEADLGRYAELYEQGSERWSKATMEEWLAGADEIMAKFTDIIDLIKEHMSFKVNLYKSLQSRLADEHSAVEQRGNDLRDASQTLVRDSGRIGGGFESNGIDASGF